MNLSLQGRNEDRVDGQGTVQDIIGAVLAMPLVAEITKNAHTGLTRSNDGPLPQ